MIYPLGAMAFLRVSCYQFPTLSQGLPSLDSIFIPPVKGIRLISGGVGREWGEGRTFDSAFSPFPGKSIFNGCPDCLVFPRLSLSHVPCLYRSHSSTSFPPRLFSGGLDDTLLPNCLGPAQSQDHMRTSCRCSGAAGWLVKEPGSRMPLVTSCRH